MTTVCYSAIICKRSQGVGGARVGPAAMWREGGRFWSLPPVLNQAECIIPLIPVFLPLVETPLRVDVAVLKARAKLLQKYLCDEQKELQALYALQALVVTLEQPASKSQATGVGVGWRNCQIVGVVVKGSQLKNGGWSLEQNIPMVEPFPLQHWCPYLQVKGVRLSLEG